MAEQAFKAPHRNAIWTAYGYKCFYCHEQLRWDALRVDHVVPEYLAKDLEKRALVFRDLALPDDWRLTDNHNLVAACDRCNSRKRALIPEPNQMMLWLAEAREKAPVIGFLRERYERQLRGDILRAKLETALATGHLEEEQLRHLLSTASPAADASFLLTTGIELLDGIQISELRPSEMQLLLDVPVKLGADLPEGLKLEKDDGTSLNVRTCREYRDAVANRYYAATNFAMKMEAFFTRTLGVLEALGACRPAAQSYIRRPRLGICDLERLPSSLLPFFDITEEARQNLRTHPTVGSLVAGGVARVTSVSSCEVEVLFAGTFIRLREILRADLDGDGIEDILVSLYIRADGGTLGAGISPFALALRGHEEQFTVTTTSAALDVE
jgi:hypothetical protein